MSPQIWTLESEGYEIYHDTESLGNNTYGLYCCGILHHQRSPY